MTPYTKDQLKLIKERLPSSIYSRIKRTNSFIDNNYSLYIEATHLVSQGTTKWQYSTSLEDIKFYVSTNLYILNAIN